MGLGHYKSKISNVMYYVDIERKRVIWRCHVNQLKPRLAYPPFRMDSTNSEHSEGPQAPTTSSNVIPSLRQSTCKSEKAKTSVVANLNKGRRCDN